MFTKNKISKMFSALFIVMFLLAGAFPAQAESLAKPLSASGDFLWAKSFGGTGFDYGRSIAVDSNGNVYTTGHFQDTVDFDPGVATFNMTSIGGTDIFVSKLDSSGNFVWAKRIGSTDPDSGSMYDDSNDIALDSNGNVYITGQFQGTADFNPGAATANLTSVGVVDIFIAKLDTDGNFVWAKSIGGSGWEYASSIAIDLNGNVLTTGRVESAAADFDPGVGTFPVNNIGGGDVFISKLDNNGNFVWAKVMGSVHSEGGFGIAVDASGNVYTTGYYNQTVDFDPGAGIFNITTVDQASFTSKLDSAGNFLWAKSNGGDVSVDIALDSNGNVYTTGYFHELTDFDPDPVAVFNLIDTGDLGIYISKLNSSGNFVWAKMFDGAGVINPNGDSFKYSYGIAVDSSGNVYTTGEFDGIADFDPGPATFNLTNPSEYTDAYISKLDTNGNFVWAKSLSGPGYESGQAITLDSQGNVYTTGVFDGTPDFDPGTGTANLTSLGRVDVFISKLENASGGPTTLVNSVLPTSRSIPVGTMATIFNTVINAGASTANGVTLSISPAPAGTFVYQQTNCATNAIIGLPNPSLDMAPNGVLCYVLSFTPSATFAATSVHIRAQAGNAPSTNLLTGINTWLLRSTASAGPDIIALTTTTDFHQMACSGANAFAVAMSNVGVAATGDITVTANTGSASLPITVLIQETNPGTGAIIGDHILNNLGTGDNRTVAVFVTFNGCVSFDPAVNRIFIEFRDASNNVVGSTSTAVSTNR